MTYEIESSDVIDTGMGRLMFCIRDTTCQVAFTIVTNVEQSQQSLGKLIFTFDVLVLACQFAKSNLRQKLKGHALFQTPVLTIEC